MNESFFASTYKLHGNTDLRVEENCGTADDQENAEVSKQRVSLASNDHTKDKHYRGWITSTQALLAPDKQCHKAGCREDNKNKIK